VVTDAVPLLSPQVVVVEAGEIVTLTEEFTVALVLAEQPPAPVTVTEYPPPERFEIIAVVLPVFQR